MNVLKNYLEENIALKENDPDVPVTGMAVLHQQFLLAQAIEEWITEFKKIIVIMSSSEEVKKVQQEQ